jgi:MFS family permease
MCTTRATESLGALSWVATLGLVAYTTCEGVGRLFAWLYSARFRPIAIVVTGGIVALAGALLIVGPGRVDAAIVGFGLVALGVGPAIPILATAASNSARAGNRSIRVGLMVTAGYLGSVIGQPVIGWIADASSLRVSLWLIALSAALVLALAGTARGAEREEGSR